MENPEIGASLTKADLARFWQALHDRDRGRPSHLWRADRSSAGADSASVADLLKNRPERRNLAAKKPQLTCRSAGWDSELWNYGQF